MKTAFPYLLTAACLLGGVAALGKNHNSVSNAPYAIVAIAQQLASCAHDTVVYRSITIDCRSPVSFADIRKLDMRADNAARSLLARK